MILVPAASILWQFSPKGYLSNEDSWAPMRAAIGLLGTPSADRLYETLFFGRHVKMQYPPTSLLPLQLLDMVGAGQPRTLNALNAGLTLVNALLVAMLADMLLSARLGLRGLSRWTVLGLAGASALAFYPVVRGVQLGQIQIWLDVAFTAACLLLARGHAWAAGVAMGFASLIKPQFLPLLLLGGLSRQWRFVAGFAAMAGGAGIASLWLYGWHNHLEYLQVLSFIGRHGEAFYANNSVNGVVNRLLANGSNLQWSSEGFAPFHPLVFAATSVTAVVLLLAPFLLRPAHADRSGVLLHFCFATLCFVMASPVVWEHHYGVLPAMFVVTMDSAMASPGRLVRHGFGAALVAAWLLAASELSPLANQLSGTILNPLQATHFAGGALLAMAMARLLLDRRTVGARQSRRWTLGLRPTPSI